jgi:leader peptidase (prepilin peptidase)/N-methyltransferase
MTIFLAPLGILLSALDLLPISWQESVCSALFGYLFLFIINRLFKWWRNIDGIGEGDFDLLLFIGSFTGIIGCWASITLGSILGSLYGITSLFFTQSDEISQLSLQTKVPFGPFLACGAIIFVLMQKSIFFFFLA